ncbi:substrate-binding periplasmic protein [Litoribacillus peritrichatus]
MKLTQSDYQAWLIRHFVAVFCLILCSLVNAKELIVGVSETDYKPFYYEEAGEFKGAAAEIAHHVAKQLGHHLTFKRFPWKRVQYNLAIGRIDMVILYFKTEERAKDVWYVDIPHIYESSSLVVSNSSDIEFSGQLLELSKRSFGNVSGYWHGKNYSENTQLLKQEYSSTTALLEALHRGKVDIGVGNKPVMTALATSMGIVNEIKFLEPKIDYAPDYIAFSKVKSGSLPLANAFSRKLKAFMKTDAYRDILHQYGFELPEN